MVLRWNDAYRIGLATAPWRNLDKGLYLPMALRDSGPCSPVWSDDFSDYHSGWPIFETADETFDYIGGEYQILLKAANAYTFGSAGVQMTDGVIVASVRFASPGDNPDNGGILFGQQLGEYTNFYRFVVVRRGDYCIQRHDVGAGWVDLKCAAASGFAPYPGTNGLKVVRNGADIAAYLNGRGWQPCRTAASWGQGWWGSSWRPAPATRTCASTTIGSTPSPAPIKSTEEGKDLIGSC